MSFQADLKAWATKVQDEFERFRKAVILELFNSVVLDSPVKSGRLRGNWIISNGSFEKETVQITDPSGAVTTAKISQHVRGLSKRDQTVFLANNLPYAYRIEYEGWSHTKAPEGMVRKNFIRISENLKRHGKR